MDYYNFHKVIEYFMCAALHCLSLFNRTLKCPLKDSKGQTFKKLRFTIYDKWVFDQPSSAAVRKKLYPFAALVISRHVIQTSHLYHGLKWFLVFDTRRKIRQLFYSGWFSKCGMLLIAKGK